MTSSDLRRLAATLSLAALLFSLSAPRLPAPITVPDDSAATNQEDSGKGGSRKAKAKTGSDASKNVSMAGDWQGTVTLKGGDGSFATSVYLIRVNPGEKAVHTNWAESTVTGQTSPARRSGNTISWQIQAYPDQDGTIRWISNCSLTLQANGTAKFIRVSASPAGVRMGTGDGILTRH